MAIQTNQHQLPIKGILQEHRRCENTLAGRRWVSIYVIITLMINATDIALCVPRHPQFKVFQRTTVYSLITHSLTSTKMEPQ